MESQLSTIKNYDAKAKQRMAELREQELAIERSEVLITKMLAKHGDLRVYYYSFFHNGLRIVQDINSVQ